MEDKIIYLICASYGAHHSSDVLSGWSTKELAEQECSRLGNNRSADYAVEFDIVECNIDKQNKEGNPINI